MRARLEGRAGGRIAQPWRDLRKLLRKPPISPTDAGAFFLAAPPVLMATSLLVATTAPFVTTVAPAGSADLIVVVGVLLLGTVALALAGLDTGTAFGGMGSSREMTIAALVEPTLLLSVFALSARVGSTSLGAIVTAGSRYAGVVRDAIVTHKEHGQLTLVKPLARLLVAAVGERAQTVDAVLTPVPSTRASIRSRGHDHSRRLARTAATLAGAPPAYPLRVEVAARFRDRHRNEWRYDHYVNGYDDGTTFTLSLVDRAYVIADGQVLTQGSPSEIIANEDVRRVYLGDMFG